MPVKVSVTAEDWQATAAELARENLRLRAGLQAAGRELNQLASAADGEEADPPPDDDTNDPPQADSIHIDECPSHNDESPSHIDESPSYIDESK